MSWKTALTFCGAILPCLSGVAGAQTLDGSYRGMFVCQQLPSLPNILRVPLDMTVTAGNVQLARPLFNRNGTRVIGNEMGSGSVDADGRMHVTSHSVVRGVIYQGDYSGMLTAAGGTLMGTQSFTDAAGNRVSRTCTAAVVEAPKAARQAAGQ